ncbi:sigma-70 family RNA polymerase sigma factor [Pedobacter sp. MC2016-14]|uniref:sigma-70 family RNA polymerase sigma factor n=1 Tax=Pedobacter sp. MC2016-14 TaxID=2897327 RepID=UPI001E65B91F|nr:sigma-70 family RNA polymerase sigma factor [Pedobacter sp. MC2016-14]MCD0489156.1 sigma-70 family RNA polymerase sigma factor [Pedobacter sp. MC2016-14]
MSFEELYHLYSKKIYRLCLRDLGSDHDAANLVHNVFLSLWENRSTLVLEKPEHYLVRAAKMQVLKHFRDSSSHRIQLNQALVAYNEIDQSTEQSLDFKELKNRVTGLVSQLPPQCAKVYRMRDEQGKKNQEIAAELQISVSAVKQHLGKAIFFLRAHLQK